MRTITPREATKLILVGIEEGQYEVAKIALNHLNHGEDTDLVLDDKTISFKTWAGNTLAVKLA